MHAAVHIPAHDRDRLKHLCRYIAHPALAGDRMTLSKRGRVRYEFRRAWRDGTTRVELEPLVPPPRM